MPPMEVFLILNGWELLGTVDEQERLMLDLADGRVTREQLTSWLEEHTKRIEHRAGVAPTRSLIPVRSHQLQQPARRLPEADYF